MLKKLFLCTMFALMIPFLLLGANGYIEGKIVDSKTDEPLSAANVILEGTSIGSVSDIEGYYKIIDVPEGDYMVSIKFIGYETVSKGVNVVAGKKVKLNFKLKSVTLEMSALEVLASIADETTPVAYSEVKSEEMSLRLGSRDIPLVLNTTPSVYSTQQGGGSGDARVNVRGFNQRNVAIMINGVPINDMENGWVYWSNWDGVGDATSSIQMQRGLSAVNLATPSIGGTMNIITDPAARSKSANFKQEIGQYGFLKSTLSFNSGLLNNKFAFNGSLVRKTGDGYTDATWTDSWAYYFGSSYHINKNNRLELYALGAPQKHGQNLYKQNIATYSADYAKSLDSYDEDALDNFVEKGYDFNQNWSPVSSSYDGEQNVGSNSFDRHSSNFINSRENFYHKPQINLNYYTKLSDKLNISSILYYSGGTGGGTGTYGDVYRTDGNGILGDDDYKFYYGPSPWTWNWDATIAMNEGNAGSYFVDKDSLYKEDGQSLGILRNSRNNQWTIGAISKAYYQLSDKLKFTTGIDWRTAEIEHYREVRDLLGGDYFVKTADEFNPNEHVVRGDEVAYNFTNNVDWVGAFAQTNYQSGPITAYGMAGYSMIKYTHTNHFKKDDSGNEVHLESDFISGMQIKGGVSFKIQKNLDVYGNVGYVEKVPIFDNVISDYTATLAENPENEKFVSFEGGVNLIGLLNNKLSSKISTYYTSWKDRSNSVGYTMQDGSEGIIFLSGMDALHEGIELEVSFQPISLFKLDASASFAKWILTDDVEGSYKDWEGGSGEEVPYTFYVKDLKVGDAPQTQFALATSFFPMKGMIFQVIGKTYQNHYANWDPFSRDALEDGERPQSWEIPNYTTFDLHTSYQLPFDLKGVNVKLFAHIFNLLDETYIQDATDNSQYNGYDSDHDADDAEVFFGAPRSWNVGLSINL